MHFMNIWEISEYSIDLGLKIAAFATIFGLVMGVVSFFVASYCVYISTLSRNKNGKWGRAPSCDDPDYMELYAKGMEWHRENIHRMEPVHILNDGLNLYGEYYSFGGEQCVIILPGRSESLCYSYFFAFPYSRCGCDVLVIDPRSHGLSEGEFSTVGFEESKDVIAWAKFAHSKYGVKNIFLHGICIGAAGGMLAITSPDCPEYISGIVTDGMFSNFNNIMRAHLVERKKPTMFMLDLIDMWMKRYTKHSMKYGPIDVIGNLNKPILMMHGTNDIFSLPEYAEQMYNICGSDSKTFVWFEGGTHSMLRSLDTQRYDSAIENFLMENYGVGNKILIGETV